LEIAPGRGRWTSFLRQYCKRLEVVDLSPSCIEDCKTRFASTSHIKYHVNDGKSLDMIGDSSIDLLVTFDSLVHAERDVVEAYLRQFPRILKPDGVGVIHHSNFGEYAPKASPHWRATTMTAQLFADICASAGLRCVGQELVNWGGDDLSDCISTFTQRGSRFDRPNVVIRNAKFMEEATRLKEINELYCF